MDEENELTTSWISDGQKVTITTKRRDGESEEDQKKRHERAVAFWKRHLPED